MDKNYAYLDNGGILHVLDEDLAEAKKRSKSGKVVETTHLCKGGYPISGGEQIIAYSPTSMKLEAQGSEITPVPSIAELYRECM